MLCERCNQKLATIYLTKIVNGQKTDHKFCIDCAKKENAFPITTDGSISVDSLLKGFFGADKTSEQNKDAVNIVCPLCGMDLLKLAERGRFGCDKCYDVFDETALKTIKRIHGHKRHMGKIPRRAGGTLNMKKRMADLRSTLEAHVLKEEYEEAASLRDEIKKLEKELTQETEAGKNE